MRHNRILIVLVVLFISLFYTNSAFAGSVTLAWDPNTEPDIAGYKIYYGTSTRTGTDPGVCGLCGYATFVDVGNVTLRTIDNLTNGQTYYFSATAYNTAGLESAFSNEVFKYVSMTADLNDDNLINAQDFSILMSSWGSTERPRADINQDGFVNAQDFSLLMSQWSY
ncbi:fibronectin type III domain-containing protein [Patescibacteria group bacterium]|nr:fibronectin type III domain-containing protein [Patescibacteria group bacterium]